MLRISCLSFALVLTTAFAFSQAAAPSAGSPSGQGFAVAAMTRPDSSQTTADSQRVVVHGDCPVSMSARQLGMGDLVSVAPGQPSKPDPGPAQRLHLTLGSHQGNSIVSAGVIVHGLDGKPALRNTDAAGSGDASRTLSVSFAAVGSGQFSASLVAHGLTAVRWIELHSITYADGSTWTAQPGACRIEPDWLMLIGMR